MKITHIFLRSINEHNTRSVKYSIHYTVKDDLFRIFQERAVLKLWWVTWKNLQAQDRICKYPASKSVPALKPLSKATPLKHIITTVRTTGGQPAVFQEVEDEAVVRQVMETVLSIL